MKPSSEGIAGVKPPGIHPIPDEVGEGLDSSYAFHPLMVIFLSTYCVSANRQ